MVGFAILECLGPFHKDMNAGGAKIRSCLSICMARSKAFLL